MRYKSTFKINKDLIFIIYIKFFYTYYNNIFSSSSESTLKPESVKSEKIYYEPPPPKILAESELKAELNNTVKSRKVSSSSSEDSLTKFLNSQPEPQPVTEPEPITEPEPVVGNPFVVTQEEKATNPFEEESEGGNPFERDLEEISDEEIDSPKAMKKAKRKALCCACCRRGKAKCAMM